MSRGSKRVDLVVNTYRGDLPFIELTLPHITRALCGAGIRERVLVVDMGSGVGRFKATDAALSDERLLAVAHRFETEGVVDRTAVLDWQPEAVAETMQTWYGDASAPTACGKGTALYQYCAAIDASDADYVLHLDSDVLIHSPDGSAGWVREAIAALDACPDAIAVQPMGGPPIATNLAQLIFGSRARPARPARGWQAGGAITSRVVLIDRERLHRGFLPLEPEDRGDRWEQAMTTTAARRGMHRYTLWDERSWVLHPLTHGPRFVRVLPDLVWAAEHGIYPFRRSGYRWDVRVDGLHVLPWIAAVRLARAGRAIDRSSFGGTQRYGGAGA